MGSFSLSLDHAALMAQFATIWDSLNYHGYIVDLMSILCGVVIVVIIKNMLSQTGETGDRLISDK